jgi:amidase
VWKAGGTKPKIGIMWHDGVVMPQAPMANALEVAVNKLRDAGYEVVDYAPYRSMEAWNIIVCDLNELSNRINGLRKLIC